MHTCIINTLQEYFMAVFPRPDNDPSFPAERSWWTLLLPRVGPPWTDPGPPVARTPKRVFTSELKPDRAICPWCVWKVFGRHGSGVCPADFISGTVCAAKASSSSSGPLLFQSVTKTKFSFLLKGADTTHTLLSPHVPR